ncbi:MAG TPA: hypothetical protein VLC12_07620 [Terriglobales bacterium]|nr:hypothetical protein [Terriglobales bacterium]
MAHSARARAANLLLAVFCLGAGAVLVACAFKVDGLHWLVDGPGWLVSRFVSIDFHEGEVAFGFFLAILLSWAGSSVAVWLVGRGIRRFLGRA